MRWKIGIILAITLGCLFWALKDVEFHKASVALSEANWLVFLPMMALYLVAHTIRALRLGLLLGQPVPFGRLFAINTIGFLAINVVPLRLGEFVRPTMLYEGEGVAFGRAMAAIMMERLLDLFCLLALLLGLSAVITLPEGGIMVQGVDVISAGQRGVAVLLGGGSLVALAAIVGGEPVIAALERLPFPGPLGAIWRKLIGMGRKFREALVDTARQPLRFLVLVAYSVAIWAVTILAVGIVMSGFEGIPATLASAWTTWTITITGMTAVPTPGFFGIYELCCAAALRLWGVSESLASTFAVVLHLGQFGFTVAIGALFMLREGLSLRSLVRAPPSVPAEAR